MVPRTDPYLPDRDSTTPGSLQGEAGVAEVGPNPISILVEGERALRHTDRTMDVDKRSTVDTKLPSLFHMLSLHARKRRFRPYYQRFHSRDLRMRRQVLQGGPQHVQAAYYMTAHEYTRVIVVYTHRP